MKKKNVGVTRNKATKILENLIARATECYFECKYEVPYYPTQIFVFGSYMGDKDKLGDVDVFIEKMCKWRELDRMFDYYQYHPDNKTTGYLNRLAYADNVFYRFLKNRSKSLSMHSLHELPVLKKQDPLIKYEKIWDISEIIGEESPLTPSWKVEYDAYDASSKPKGIYDEIYERIRDLEAKKGLQMQKVA